MEVTKIHRLVILVAEAESSIITNHLSPGVGWEWGSFNSLRPSPEALPTVPQSDEPIPVPEQ